MKRRVPVEVRGILRSGVRQARRKTLYRMLQKKNEGSVPCFVCGKHVRQKNATIEHIVPLSKGGVDEMNNLSISHYQCNQRRGSSESEDDGPAPCPNKLA